MGSNYGRTVGISDVRTGTPVGRVFEDRLVGTDDHLRSTRGNTTILHIGAPSTPSDTLYGRLALGTCNDGSFVCMSNQFLPFCISVGLERDRLGKVDLKES